jgi:hypothetical protein
LTHSHLGRLHTETLESSVAYLSAHMMVALYCEKRLPLSDARRALLGASRWRDSLETVELLAAMDDGLVEFDIN